MCVYALNDWRKNMAEFSFKRRGEYLRGIFKILYNENDGLKAKEVLRIPVKPATHSGLNLPLLFS